MPSRPIEWKLKNKMMRPLLYCSLLPDSSSSFFLLLPPSVPPSPSSFLLFLLPPSSFSFFLIWFFWVTVLWFLRGSSGLALIMELLLVLGLEQWAVAVGSQLYSHVKEIISTLPPKDRMCHSMNHWVLFCIFRAGCADHWQLGTGVSESQKPHWITCPRAGWLEFSSSSHKHTNIFHLCRTLHSREDFMWRPFHPCQPHFLFRISWHTHSCG